MEFYILKSGICLAIFYGFYKLVLEKESFHVFKRTYLLGSTVLAFIIPLITFTEYIEVIPQENPLFIPEFTIRNNIIENEPINYTPYILWSIYSLGVLLFSLKFFKNLIELIIKVRRNPKFKNHSFINVLLQDPVIPHTFFNYIFLNKQKFETHQIPKEVLLHEQTHAKQKHSLDVLFIEILQIMLWFNPFIYFIKQSIKLNHEFLADHAVISNGISSSIYQKTLLAFSSNATQQPLANAINYSSIKKRFTVMKTKTSKQQFWLRNFLLLPILAILIYSFSEKKIVEIDSVNFNSIETPQILLPEGLEKTDNYSSNTEKLKTIDSLKLNDTKKHDSKLRRFQNDSIIKDVIILINENNQILLNNKLSNIDDLFKDIKQLNPNLTTQQKRKFLHGTIKHKTNTSKDLIEKVKSILTKSDVYTFTTFNEDNVKKQGLTLDRPGLPYISKEGLNKKELALYKYKLKNYNEWLRINKPNRKLEETKNGYTIKNEQDEVIISTDPNIDAKPLDLKNSPWKVEAKTYEITEDETKITETLKAKPNNNSSYNISKVETTSIVIDADTLDELKTFDWNSLTDIFKDNNPNTLINLEFNYNKSVMIGDSKSDTFHLKLSDKASELDKMITKAKKIISSLKVI